MPVHPIFFFAARTMLRHVAPSGVPMHPCVVRLATEGISNLDIECSCFHVMSLLVYDGYARLLLSQRRSGSTPPRVGRRGLGGMPAGGGVTFSNEVFHLVLPLQRGERLPVAWRTCHHLGKCKCRCLKRIHDRRGGQSRTCCTGLLYRVQQHLLHAQLLPCLVLGFVINLITELVCRWPTGSGRSLL